MASNLVESHSSSSSRLSLNSTNEEGQAPPTFVALGMTTVSHDNVTEAQAAADSMAILLSATLEGWVWLEVWFHPSPLLGTVGGCPWRK